MVIETGKYFIETRIDVIETVSGVIVRHKKWL